MLGDKKYKNKIIKDIIKILPQLSLLKLKALYSVLIRLQKQEDKKNGLSPRNTKITSK